MDSLEKRKNILKREYKRLIKKSSARPLSGWKLFIKDARGHLYLRCQSKTANSSPPIQCPNKALKGALLCQHHGRRLSSSENKIKIKEMKRQLGIYDIGEQKQIIREMRSIESLTEEELKNVEDEIKLMIALLRRYLKEKSDKEIMKNPGRLLWMINNVIGAKKTHWEMTHDPTVCFTINQVEFLFNTIRTIIINEVKDINQLKNIASKIKSFSLEIREGGLKVK